MGCKVNPGLRNMKAIYETYISLYNENKKHFDNEFDFYFYDGGNDTFSVKKYEKYANIIHCVSGDDINNTYQKTIESYEWIVNNKNYDWVVRVNISAYVNMFVLDKFLNCADKDKVYANMFCAYLHNWHYLNDCFPRGDAHILSFEVLKKAISIKDSLDVDSIEEGMDKVDDTLMGILYMKAFEDLYVNHYSIINYCFLPQEVWSIKKNEAPNISQSLCYIFTRLKTCPPDVNSGYSWDDNLYREQDFIKFHIVNNLVKEHMSVYYLMSNDKIHSVSLDNASSSSYIPYLDLKECRLDGISFEGLKNIIIKKHNTSIIY